ncbi:DUF1310 family protein [Gemella morbillorum]|jgi:hypothetical protein|uniref:DUF1310 family protein n=1 Tax=Gemella morbillorum TaxID=29391 RepID=UPI0023F26F98|nr:DUF1310 family protein [Gemella morbillorum]
MKKVLLGILTTIVIIGILIVGKIKIDDYRVKNIVHSEEVKVVVEKMIKKFDDTNLTERGVIKSYRIDYDYSEKNPMGGINIRIIVNNDEEQVIKTVINKYSSSRSYENGIIFTSPKLSKILREHSKEK